MILIEQFKITFSRELLSKKGLISPPKGNILKDSQMH